MLPNDQVQSEDPSLPRPTRMYRLIESAGWVLKLSGSSSRRPAVNDQLLDLAADAAAGAVVRLDRHHNFGPGFIIARQGQHAEWVLVYWWQANGVLAHPPAVGAAPALCGDRASAPPDLRVGAAADRLRARQLGPADAGRSDPGRGVREPRRRADHGHVAAMGDIGGVHHGYLSGSGATPARCWWCTATPMTTRCQAMA